MPARVSEPLDADAAVGGSVGLRTVRARTRAAEPARSWPQVGVDLLRDLRPRPAAAPRSPVPHDTATATPSSGLLAADRPVAPHRAAAPPPALVCSAVGARYRNRRTPTISGIDLVLPAQGVLAVVGPSGSGKSTLCAAILGEVEDVSGHVLVDGVAILETPDLAPRLVSFVPQRDALHNELTPRQALGLTADLRLAPSVPKAERERRVAEVLGLLELASHADRRIGQLSGGQRKRVAVAMELLSNPRLLMLDEPTSGLDEGLDLVMMRLLRRVADDGRGVIVVTHSTANLNLADVVLALDIHGKVAFSGPPDGLLEALGVTTYAEAMAALRNGTATAETVGTPAARRDDSRPATDGARARSAEISAAVARRTRRAPAGTAPEIGLVHTSAVLTRRELTRFAANRLTLLRGLFVLPVLSCLLTAWAADRGLAGTPDDPNPWQGVALSVVVTCTTFFAMAMSFGTIVGDRDVIEREYRWGVRPVAVVLAKALALAGPVAFQSLVTMSLYLALRDGPERPLDVGTPLLVMTGSLMMLGLSSAALGLLISASSRTLERAILLLMGSVALLVVLSGLLIPLAHPEGLGGHTLALIAHTTPSRWGTAALASYVGYVPDPLPGMAPGDTSLQDALWVHDVGHLTDAITSMASLGVTYTVAAMFLLTRQCGRRR
ncbi:ATP-binding cassette domain-containing protein [Kineosporia sp. A_224]|uniref:ATP-binding cassette domain-containing protein n=1 Tax=Kineosporia sp. A_224 TaxID=1962180 RepID=UPI0011799F95|nr:ATP-binding cassette domain-containing protein [Kineosporia sp. A_224]